MKYLLHIPFFHLYGQDSDLPLIKESVSSEFPPLSPTVSWVIQLAGQSAVTVTRMVGWL